MGQENSLYDLGITAQLLRTIPSPIRILYPRPIEACAGTRGTEGPVLCLPSSWGRYTEANSYKSMSWGKKTCRQKTETRVTVRLDLKALAVDEKEGKNQREKEILSGRENQIQGHRGE